jgi:tetratricopeptide (TPR) repeat protein
MNNFIGHSRTAVVAAILALLTFLLFRGAMPNDFVSYDDPDYVTANPAVQVGLSVESGRWAFTTGHAGNWHPLTWLSHQADVQMHGLTASGHHLTSLLLHCANAALLFLFLNQVTGALWRSALVAALFAVHPLRVESVAWVAERKDVLCAFFFLLTLLAQVRYLAGKSQLGTRNSEFGTPQSQQTLPSPSREAGGGGQGEVSISQSYSHSYSYSHSTRPFLWYSLALFCFALALLSKPMAVTLPFVLLLLDFWPLRRLQLSTLNFQPSTPLPQLGTRNSEPRTEKEQQTPPSPPRSGRGKGEVSTPLGTRNSQFGTLLLEKFAFFALALASCIITFLVQQRGGAMTSTASVSERISNAVVAYGRYLFKTVWPDNLAVFYPYPTSWPIAWVIGSAILLLAISWFALRRLNSQPALAVGWLWFLGMLVPAIGLVQVGWQSLADRYTYLPQIGLFLALVFAWPLPSQLPTSWRQGIATATVALLAALGWQTTRQITHWRDSESLFRHALAVTERNEVAHNNLGVALQRRGDWAPAAEQHAAAIAIKPDYIHAQMNLGNCLMRLGDSTNALAHLQRALELAPTAKAHYNLGTALLELGRREEARASLLRAVTLDAGMPEAQLNLGVVEMALGDPATGAVACRAAIALRPAWSEAWLQLGNALSRQKDFAAAAEAFAQSARLNERDTTALFNLANAYVELDKVREAIATLDQLLVINPADLEARRLLANLRFRTGDAASAVLQLEQIVRAAPGPGSHLELAQGLLAAGRRGEAIAEYRAVLQLQPEHPVALNDLAWLLATHPDATARNGAEAVKFAEKACALTQRKNPLLIGTLAAAYAEAARFDEAIKSAVEAIALAKGAGLPQIVERNEELLKLYRAGKPFHEP